LGFNRIVTRTEPSFKLLPTGKPLRAKSPGMAEFAGSTSASNRVIPDSCAIAARCLKIRDPIPQPW
jgi:hypothetical protein